MKVFYDTERSKIINKAASIRFEYLQILLDDNHIIIYTYQA